MTKRDLFLVVADLDAENTLKTLLTHRQPALEINLEFDPVPPPNGDLLRYNKRDSGCYRDAVNLLRPPQKTHRHALICFDRDGSGMEHRSSGEIEEQLEVDLLRNGWSEGDVAAIVIEPELEVWVWANSIEVSNAVGWNNDMNDLREFLSSNGYWIKGQPKPSRPKEALERAVKQVRKPGGSSAVFADVARKVSLKSCEDRSFMKLRRVLKNWFPITQSTIEREREES